MDFRQHVMAKVLSWNSSNCFNNQLIMGEIDHPLDDWDESLEIVRIEIKTILETPNLQPTEFALRKEARGTYIVYCIDIVPALLPLGSMSPPPPPSEPSSPAVSPDLEVKSAPLHDPIGDSLVILVKDDRSITEDKYFPTKYRNIIGEMQSYVLSFCNEELHDEFGKNNGKGWKMFLLASGY